LNRWAQTPMIWYVFSTILNHNKEYNRVYLWCLSHIVYIYIYTLFSMVMNLIWIYVIYIYKHMSLTMVGAP
jgi:hypothetical protein